MLLWGVHGEVTLILIIITFVKVIPQNIITALTACSYKERVDAIGGLLVVMFPMLLMDAGFLYNCFKYSDVNHEGDEYSTQLKWLILILVVYKSIYIVFSIFALILCCCYLYVETRKTLKRIDRDAQQLLDPTNVSHSF